MSDAWQSIKIRRFEHIAAGPTTSLLRLNGKPLWRRGPSPRPILLLNHRGEAHRFAALAAPEDPRGTLRAAYSVPSNLIAPDSRFSLEHPDGAVTELPQPVVGDSGTDADDFDPGAAHDVDGQSKPPAKLAEQSQELAQAQRAAAESDEARRRIEADLARARETLRIMTFERDALSRQATALDGDAVKERERAAKAEAENEEMSATLCELEVWRGELERRLAATTSELGMLKAAREADESELERLREALAETVSRAELGGQRTESSQTLAAQAAEIELLMAELAALRGARTEALPHDRPADQSAGNPADPESTGIARRAEELQAALQDALVPAQALVELARSRLDTERKLRSAAGD